MEILPWKWWRKLAVTNFVGYFSPPPITNGNPQWFTYPHKTKDSLYRFSVFQTISDRKHQYTVIIIKLSWVVVGGLPKNPPNTAMCVTRMAAWVQLPSQNRNSRIFPQTLFGHFLHIFARFLSHYYENFTRGEGITTDNYSTALLHIFSTR